MFSPPVRWCLLLLALGLTLSSGSGQPPEDEKKRSDQIPPTKWDREDYTAFPDLKMTVERKEVKGPDGQPRLMFEETPIPLPPLPELGAKPTPLRRVQYEQLCAGLRYVDRVEHAVKIQGPDPSTFLNDCYMANEVYRVAAELEEKPAKRVPWYEARVLTFKRMEEYTKLRVNAGSSSRSCTTRCASSGSRTKPSCSS